MRRQSRPRPRAARALRARRRQRRARRRAAARHARGRPGRRRAGRARCTSASRRATGITHAILQPARRAGPAAPTSTPPTSTRWPSRSTTSSTSPRRPPTSSAATASRRRWSRPRRSATCSSPRPHEVTAALHELRNGMDLGGHLVEIHRLENEADQIVRARRRAAVRARHRPDDRDPLEGHLRDARGVSRRLRAGRQRPRGHHAQAALAPLRWSTGPSHPGPLTGDRSIAPAVRPSSGEASSGTTAAGQPPRSRRPAPPSSPSAPRAGGAARPDTSASRSALAARSR